MTAGDYSTALEAIAAASNRSPLEVLEAWLERSSIREHDGGLDRAEAERLAVRDCQEVFCGPLEARSFAPERAARPAGATGVQATNDCRSELIASGSKP